MIENDVNERYLSWFRDEKVTQYLDAKNLSHEDAITFLREGQASGTRYQFAVCTEDAGLHIGSVKLGVINRTSRMSDLVTVIGDRNFWGKGIATTAIRQVSEIAFQRHNMRKLNAGILSGNIGSIKAYTRGGWVVEAILYSHHVSAHGVRSDQVIISCFNPAEYGTLPRFPLVLPPI